MADSIDQGVDIFTHDALVLLLYDNLELKVLLYVDGYFDYPE